METSHVRTISARKRSKCIDDVKTLNILEVPHKNIRIKIISMGGVATGKSCLIKRFCEGRFISKYMSTIGVDFGVREIDVDGMLMKVNFWDLSGNPDYFDIRNEFYSDSQGAILVFDVSRRESFYELQSWMDESRRFGLGNVPIVICANQIDKKRAISEDEGREWARGRGIVYFETSACTGINVNAAFNRLFLDVKNSIYKY